jgi:hypothetical protein
MLTPALAYRPTGADSLRWEAQARAWRLLYGHWRADLEDRIRLSVGDGRADAWGAPDIGSNLLLAASSAVATLYDRGVHAHHDDRGAAERLTAALLDAAWQPILQRNQRDTIAIRESAIRVDVIAGEDGRRLSLVPVPPHMMEVETDPADPTRAVCVKWWRLRTTSTGAHVWTCDVTDIRPGRERYAIEDEAGHDVSALYLLDATGAPAPVDGYRGADYPYRAGGRPILPWVIYHAAVTGQLWDYSANAQIVDSTLTIGTLWTYWRHLVQSASWPQRYLIGGQIGGQGSIGEGDSGRRQIVADPAVLLRIVPDETQDASPSIHQDATNADPEALQRAIQAYELSKVGLAGLNPADVMRVSGDPRSGYAMAITRDGQREAQRRYAPAFRLADQHLCRVAAALLGGLPVDGWRVSYEDIPLTVGEQIELQRFVDAEVTAGRMSALEAYAAMHPELSPEDSAARLDAIQALRAPEDRGPLMIGQLTTMLDIVREAASGAIPRDAATAMLATTLGADESVAVRLLGSAGLTPPPTPASPFGGAPTADPDREDDDERPDPARDPARDPADDDAG